LALRIAMKKEWVILLTGTPVVNKPIDLFPQLAIMGHLNIFGGRKGFLTRYCEGGRGASNLKELNYLLNKHCFFRREKKDVAKDLPEKQRQTILCDITTRAEYNRAKNEFVSYLKDKDFTDAEIAKKLRGEIMVKMGELKRISALGKLNEVKEFVNEVLESGEKLIVFASLHSIVDAMKSEYPNAVTVTGRDNQAQKQHSIDSFQNNPDCKLIICNIKAAGVGITLTASSRVAFIEYPWTYSDCVQCEDRAHRIGQKNNVMVTYFLGHKTIDEQMFELIKSKAETANAITGATDQMETSYVDKMLNLLDFKNE
ncbi:MAG TPA: DEAD/DEAH box helicase, partial [Flavobacteriaceae bacterium]|nr:DEAD/DEAH box helicase [Flavobacteriaceae bacterium]